MRAFNLSCSCNMSNDFPNRLHRNTVKNSTYRSSIGHSGQLKVKEFLLCKTVRQSCFENKLRPLMLKLHDKTVAKKVEMMIHLKII